VAGSRPYSISPAFRRQPRLQSSGRSLAGSTTPGSTATSIGSRGSSSTRRTLSSGGVADPALRTLLTRGRAPGVSLVCATQRPGALPSVAVSQSDLLVAHRLTAERDLDRLAEAEATYLAGDLASRLPTETGEALVVDDATETAHTVRIRERRTPHGGGSPSASGTAAAKSEDPR